MAQTAEAGGRVVLVVATKGERGEPQPGVLSEGESLWERRIPETFRSAQVLGADRVEFLGYVDSGMMDEDTNNFPYSFWQADVDQAANRLAAILKEESADILTTYDDHGGYGHPDHIQVHRVGKRAAEIAGTPRVLEATMNRDRIRSSLAEVAAMSEEGEPDAPEPQDDLGTAEADITIGLDVTNMIDKKRDAMTAHESQISEDSWFLRLKPELFIAAFGHEWYIEAGNPRIASEGLRSSVW